MANIKSQIKRNKQNEKRRVRNKAVRSELNTAVKTALGSAGEENAEESLTSAIKQIDRAATKKIIHKNAAARRKSRLIAKFREIAGSK